VYNNNKRKKAKIRYVVSAAVIVTKQTSKQTNEQQNKQSRNPKAGHASSVAAQFTLENAPAPFKAADSRRWHVAID